MSAARQPTIMTRGPDGTRIGLCLSGGGFRAALYGLGVVRYLAEAGLLSHVQAVSAVSGGSVAAAVLADRWPAIAADGYSLGSFLREVQAPVHEALASHNMRNEAVARWAGRRLTLRGRSRGSAMGDVMVDRLLQARRVTDLDPALQVVLTSTDLCTGRAFRVSRDFIGSYDFGYQPAPEALSLGQAVAASAAVPVLFPPVYLPTAGLGLRAAPEVLSLVDGGVYDNLGLEWFQGWKSGRPATAREVDFLIVVDASGPLVKQHATLGGLRAVNRGRQIQYTQTRATRIRWFVEELIAGRMHGTYLISKYDPSGFRHPDGSPIDPRLHDGALPAGFASKLASLRTDLDRFRREESELLSYHGYWSTHARLGALHPELAVAAEPSWCDYQNLAPRDADALQTMLAAGTKRRLRL
ncbi:MAG TPA: patatin-like phospholipase family protein [Solirubrobacteraceae bacterium]|nr:patatin-like phospholipase family protein [Solirubrobacteraceae bacterium]